MNKSSFIDLKKNALKFEDGRGYLEILYESKILTLKRSFSKAGVFRGMHYQPSPNLQTKIIRVIRGRIMDFIIDMNHQVKKVEWRELSVDDGWVRISSNYAHGFYALEETEFEYICDGEYDEKKEVIFSIRSFIEEKFKYKNLLISAKDAGAEEIDLN